jgi:hypothetical protein
MKRALFEDEHNWFRESVAAFVDRELMPRRQRFREQIMKEVIGRSLGLEEPRG